MRDALRTLRKLVLGETWTVPLGVLAAVALAAALRLLSGEDGWWREGGGFVLLAAVLIALIVSVERGVRPPRR